MCAIQRVSILLYGINVQVYSMCKICCTCQISKSLSEFSKNITQKDGLQRACKVCCKIVRDRYSLEYKRESAMRHRVQNNIEFRKYRKYWYNQHKDKWATYVKIKGRNDSTFRIVRALRSRLNSALKNKYIIHSQHTLDLLGCDLMQLKNHLTLLFQEGMTWDNYGKFGWEIDHKRPCASFDLSNSEQQRECFHYTNLQPLWKSDNRMKSNTYTYEKLPQTVN